MEQKLYDAAAKLPVTHAQLDISAVPLKQNNGVRRMVLTFAACAAAICLVLFSALFLAGQVRQYRDAVAYFEQYGLSTEGLTHKEIKDVYLDIITESFSHPKTAGVLASKNPSEEILYCPAPMTKETYKRLFSTESDDWDPSTFWSEDNQNRNLRRYYGTYNGLDVMPQKIQIQSIETYTIAGFDFICNACNIMVKKDGGAGVTLQAAYEHGLLTDKDIEAIYNYHKQTEAALYEEFATNYTLPEYTPGSIKLAAKDAYTTWAPKDRQYRMSYYLIMGDFADVVRKSQPDAYNQWKSGINEAIMRGEWNDEMLLVSYIKHFNIPRASMEAALANYIYERTPEQLKMEFYEAPNLDIIYTFDNDIINNYYRYELAPTDSIPQSNLDPVTGLPIGVPEGFVLAPQDAGELAPLNRKYRICYYNAMGAFSSLGSDRPEERDAILQEIWAEVKQGIYRDEMFLVSIIKGLNISREEFDRAYAKSMLQYDPESIMTEYYEIPNGDIIYTFDNEIINAYYRYEEPDWGVVIPKLSENKDHMWFDGQEYHYVDWHIGPDAYIYRDGYYMIWGEFLELANNRPGKSLDEWVKLRIAEADTAQTCNEAALVSFLKYFEIPKEDFETALAKFLSRHTPQELSWDYYWVLADADIIYTFDNEVINAYYRGEGSVVVPEPTDPTDPITTEPTDPTDGPPVTDPTDPPEQTDDPVFGPGHIFEEHVTLTWCFPDAYGAANYADLERIVTAINEVVGRKINATIEIEFIDIGLYTDKMQMKYHDNSQWDICFTSDLWNDYSYAVEQNAFSELPMSFLEVYAKDVLDALDPAVLDAAKVNGKLYAIPTQQVHAKQSNIHIATELADSVGFDYTKVSKLEDLEPYFDMLKANGVIECFIDAEESMYTMQAWMGLDYICDSWTPGAISVYDDSCTVINQFETAEFRELAQLMYKWRQKGYFLDGTASSSEVHPVYLAGDAERGAWFGGESVHIVPIGQAIVTTNDINTTSIAISRNCENPGRALAFINLLYSDEELLNLICHGQEGIDWTWADKANKVIDVNYEGYPGNYASLVGNAFNDYYTSADQIGAKERVLQANENAVVSPILGFSYNGSQKHEEINRCTEIVCEYVWRILGGRAGDPDAAIAKMNAELYEAGLQDVLDDMQKQVDEWKATRRQ